MFAKYKPSEFGSASSVLPIVKPLDFQSKDTEPEVTFNADAEKDNWVMKITRDKIIFNRERFPNDDPDDFALAVIDILEKCYRVKFEKTEPPYDR